MQITQIHAHLHSGEYSDLIFVEIKTSDPSVSGWGECTLPGKPYAQLLAWRCGRNIGTIGHRYRALGYCGQSRPEAGPRAPWWCCAGSSQGLRELWSFYGPRRIGQARADRDRCRFPDCEVLSPSTDGSSAADRLDFEGLRLLRCGPGCDRTITRLRYRPPRKNASAYGDCDRTCHSRSPTTLDRRTGRE